MNPIQLFNDWYSEELKRAQVRIPSACCLSTMGLDGYPNARFVSLKEVIEDTFIITGPVNSRKGLEIEKWSKVALVFWWAHTEKQVRIQGEASRISEQSADNYFSERAKDAQIVSVISEQGKEMYDLRLLNQKYKDAEVRFFNKRIKRPDHWGGYSIKPVRMEFMEFKPTRFHDRVLYELINNEWTFRQLQP